MLLLLVVSTLADCWHMPLNVERGRPMATWQTGINANICHFTQTWLFCQVDGGANVLARFIQIIIPRPDPHSRHIVWVWRKKKKNTNMVRTKIDFSFQIQTVPTDDAWWYTAAAVANPRSDLLTRRHFFSLVFCLVFCGCILNQLVVSRFELRSRLSWWIHIINCMRARVCEKLIIQKRGVTRVISQPSRQHVLAGCSLFYLFFSSFFSLLYSTFWFHFFYFFFFTLFVGFIS